MAAEGDDRPLSGRVAASAGSLASRRLILMVVSALTTALVTRTLGPTGYGQYGSAIATWTLIGAAADFGFSLALTRDLPHAGQTSRALVDAALRVSLPWSALLALGMTVLALIEGIDTPRGFAMLVLAPSLISFGFTPARSVFMANFRVRDVVRIDVAVVVIQSVLVAGAAIAGLGPAALAAIVSVSTAVNLVLVWRRSLSMLGGAGTPQSSRLFARRAVPLGILALMTQAYFMIDLVLIGFLLTGPTVGDYAGASKLLTVLTAVTGLVTAAALPAFSAERDRPAALQALMASVWHWLMVTALPIFVGLCLFAHLAVDVAIGSQFTTAGKLLSILALAGIVSVANNFVGTLLVATGRTRTLFAQNGVALSFNVVGNLLLLPRYGVEAAAWMTLATEVITCTGAAVVVARQIGFAGLPARSARPLAALALSTAVVLAVPGPDGVTLVVGLLAYVGAASALRAWPPEFAQRVSALRSSELTR